MDAIVGRNWHSACGSCFWHLVDVCSASERRHTLRGRTGAVSAAVFHKTDQVFCISATRCARSRARTQAGAKSPCGGVAVCDCRAGHVAVPGTHVSLRFFARCIAVSQFPPDAPALLRGAAVLLCVTGNGVVTTCVRGVTATAVLAGGTRRHVVASMCYRRRGGQPSGLSVTFVDAQQRDRSAPQPTAAPWQGPSPRCAARGPGVAVLIDCTSILVLPPRQRHCSHWRPRRVPWAMRREPLRMWWCRWRGVPRWCCPRWMLANFQVRLHATCAMRAAA
jgi:hypothetical protein